jgi:hypothetical protein
MRKVLLLMVATAVLCVPAVSVAGALSPSPSKPAAKTETPGARNDASNPAKTCKGRGAGGSAFGKCVSTFAKDTPRNDGETNAERKADDGAESHGRGTANPATTCKAMEASARARFQAAYGTRPNAFGSCVAGHANEKSRTRPGSLG